MEIGINNNRVPEIQIELPNELNEVHLDKDKLMHILGNFKGGVINAEEAYERINKLCLKTKINDRQ